MADNNADDKPGGIYAFVAHTSAIGNVIMRTAHKESFEPLPFTDYSLFNEEGGIVMKLSIVRL